MMSPRIASFVFAMGCSILIVALPGCMEDIGPFDLSDGEWEPPEPLEVRSVELVPDSVALTVGQVATLTAIVTMVDGSIRDYAQVEFWSSDTTVATVSVPDTGPVVTAVVMGRAVGVATISAMYRGKGDWVQVIVN